MSLENELNVFYALSLMSVIDISLTYYLLWYDRKTSPKKPRLEEVNGLAAWIMKLTKNGPWGIIFGSLLSQTLIWVVPFWAKDPITTLAIGDFFAGAIFVAIWMHIYHIKQFRKMRKDKEKKHKRT